MTVLQIPEGWEERERHLIEWHGLEPLAVDHMDSLMSRAVHRHLHANGAADRSHSHQP